MMWIDNQNSFVMSFSKSQRGRNSLLQLAHRMSPDLSIENLWRPLPVGNEEEILIRPNFNLDDPDSPCGVSLTFVTSLWLVDTHPVPVEGIFEFLPCGSSRINYQGNIYIIRNKTITSSIYEINGSHFFYNKLNKFWVIRPSPMHIVLL